MHEIGQRMFRTSFGSRAQGPCDRLFGACRQPRWSRPRPFVGIVRPQRIGKAKFDQRAHGIRLEIDAGA